MQNYAEQNIYNSKFKKLSIFKIRIIYIYIFIKNLTTDIRFPAFSLARRKQVISSYTSTTKYGQ